ncbi:MAG: response regulator transcription factor [Candidatus Acidiferrales bacterium]|jgi:DNA-binding NarL/FixJ family response regulator
MEEARLRILIVDDHEIFRRGLRTVLETRPDFAICGEATDGLDAIEKTKALDPDIIVMDVSMPRVDGLQALRIIRGQSPRSKVLILSQHDSTFMLEAAVKAGAGGYVTKSQVARCLLTAIDNLSQGRPFSWNSEELPAVAANGNESGQSQ